SVNEINPSPTPMLYNSLDPEFYPWEPVFNAPGLPDKNPQGAISNMAVFNNRIYVGVSNPDGAQNHYKNVRDD
nr:hypothetical protein [Bacillota bacterium]